MADTRPLGPIEHVIVLMFENRSFDNMLGGLYPHGPGFDGVPPGWSNPTDPDDPKSTQVPAFQAPPGAAAHIMPFPDPNEDYADMAEQIRNGKMTGFVHNYAKAVRKRGHDPDAVRDIMQYYAPGPEGNIPVTSALAQAYAVSDRYFGSGPVQTWANRLFAHCATPGSHEQGGRTYAYLNNVDYPNYHDIDPFFGQLDFPTVFERLDAAHGDPDHPAWKVYYDGEVPVSAFLKYVHERWETFSGGNVYPLRSEVFHDFFDDVREGTLPKYSFLEPRYQKFSAEGSVPPNSNHPGGSTVEEGLPPISIHFGEALLAKIYKALAANPELFRKTLLMVTYDEHGGLSDHVRPPPAVSPYADPDAFANFNYDRYGPRVPALFINPYIQPRTVFRPSKGVFDHTSIIATLRAQFDLGDSLTPRDAAAPTFEGLVDATRALNPGVTLPELSEAVPEGYDDEEPEDYAPPSHPGTLMDAVHRSYRAKKASGSLPKK